METKGVVLPPIKEAPFTLHHFPTPMQAFIFRNWWMVKKEKLAEILETTVENVVCEAERMGLGAQGDTDIWLKKGYISIIRANWHLITYPQLCNLLEITEDRLAGILKDEDFLDIKMGCFKPFTEPLKYAPLTPEQLEQTKIIADSMKKYVAPVKMEKKPFDFYSEEPAKKELKAPFDGAVIIDGTWQIEDNTNDKIAAFSKERFQAHVKAAWDLDFCDNSDKKITLEIISEADGKPTEEEYHELYIKKDGVLVKGGSAAGVMRGLYRIESIFNANSGPYLKEGTFKRSPKFKIRYLHAYSGLYHTALEVDSKTFCPDKLLEMYAKTGVNGIWLHSVLSQLSPFPFDESVSKGYEEKRKNLKAFVDRAALYGIKIYLYLNEPRSMPLEFYKKYPDMKGAESRGYACMCTTSDKVKKYLKDAVYSLCSAVPGLGGFFTITMSENDTHCKSRGSDTPCPRCASRPTWELVSEVNNLIYAGAREADKNVKLIAWNWAWTAESGLDYENIEKLIKSLPDDMSIMCNREKNLSFERGGVKNHVRDYTISVSGISEETLKVWEIAKNAGHETTVKAQINNTWECSTVPYIPTFHKIKEHIEDMTAAGVSNIMLGWSLGGYPSKTISMISEYFFEENGELKPDFDFAFKSLFEADSEKVKQASICFSRAFEEFPFDIRTLYNGPQNSGVSNPLFPYPTGYGSTMTCWPYDDLEKWHAVYPVDIFENQLKLLCDEWENGLEKLDGVKGEISDVSYVSYTLFKSSYNQVRFVRTRDKYLSDETSASEKQSLKAELTSLVADELEMANEVYKIMLRLPEIGFEAANHYYFSIANMAEKIVNCTYLLELYK